MAVTDQQGLVRIGLQQFQRQQQGRRIGLGMRGAVRAHDTVEKLKQVKVGQHGDRVGMALVGAHGQAATTTQARRQIAGHARIKLRGGMGLALKTSLVGQHHVADQRTVLAVGCKLRGHDAAQRAVHVGWDLA